MKQHKIISILLIILLVISIPTFKVNAAKTTYKYSFEYTSIFAYNGKVQKPTSVTVKVNGKKVAKSKVTISKYSNSKSTNPGKYTLTVKLGKPYNTSKTLNYTIKQPTYTYSYTKSFIYNGKVQKPTSVTVKANDVTIDKSKVTISKYSNTNSIEPDTYTITVKLGSPFNTSKVLSYNIVGADNQIQGTVNECTEIAKDRIWFMDYTDNGVFMNFFHKYGGASNADGIKNYLTSINYRFRNIEITNPKFGCSSGASQTNIYGRNYDLTGETTSIIMRYKKDGCYSSISTVDIGMADYNKLRNTLTLNEQGALASFCPVDGMNEKGFYISILMLDKDININQNVSGKTNLTPTTLVRYLLNNAKDVNQAKQLISNINYHSFAGTSVHFAMADSSGNGVVCEFYENGPVYTQAKVVTNHYLGGNYKSSGTETDGDSTYARYNRLYNYYYEYPNATEDDVKSALEDVSKPDTEWSVIYNPTTLNATYYFNRDYNTPYSYEIK